MSTMPTYLVLRTGLIVELWFTTCKRLVILTGATLAVLLVLGLNQHNSITSSLSLEQFPFDREQIPGVVTIGIIMCNSPSEDKDAEAQLRGIGRQMRQVKVMLKSLLLSEYEHNRTPKFGYEGQNGSTVEVLVFTDDRQIFVKLERYLFGSGEFHADYVRPLILKYFPVVYPKGFEHFRYFFRPCATYRLFLAHVLPGYDSILYVDTDVIFLKPAAALHAAVNEFSERQWCGLGRDFYHKRSADWSSIPYYGDQGVNSGVGVYNLTRMRLRNFHKEVQRVYDTFHSAVAYAGDQDILNVYFSFHPDEVNLQPCGFNYIPHFCMPGNACAEPPADGIAILHGCANAFFPQTEVSLYSTVFQEFGMLSLSNKINHELFKANLHEKLLARHFGVCAPCAENKNFIPALINL